MNEDQTGVLTTTPEDQADILRDKAQPLGTTPGADLGGYKDHSLWDSAKAGWQRYTFVNQATMAAAVVNGISATDDYDPTYNQYAYAAKNKAEYADIWENVLAGHFDEVRSETGFKRRAQMIRENKTLDEEITNGGLSGQLAGMGLSLFDVTTLVGGGAFVGAAKGAGALTNVARAAKIGLVEGAITEAAMQQMDPTQTWKDAVVNIGFSGLAGGALGGLAHFVMPHTKLGLQPENIGRHEEVIERVPGGTRDDELKLTNERTPDPEFSDAGAAAVRPGTAAAAEQILETDTEIALGGRVSQFADNVFSKMLMGSPLGRLKHMPPVLRGYLTQGMDQFGLLNRGMARGQAAAPEAEAFRNNYLHKGKALQEELTGILRKTQVDLGDSALGARFKGAVDTMSHGKLQNNTLKREDFFNEVFQDMSAYMTKDPEVEKKIKDRLASRGYDETQVNTIYGRVKEASTAAKRHMDEFSRDAVESGLMDPKLLQENYGLPVMYVRGAINKNPRAFEAAMFDLLKGQPPKEELRKLGHVWDAVEADATKGIEAKPARTMDDLKKDPELWSQAQREWAGEQEYLQREMAAAKWTDAEDRLKRTMAEVESMTDGLKLHEADKKVKTVGAARQRARLAEADWHERNLGTSMARVERAEAKVADIESKYPELFGLKDDAARTKVEAGNALDAATGKAQRAADDAADGQYLTDFLKSQRTAAHAEHDAAKLGESWQSKRDQALTREQIDEINADLKQALREREEAKQLLAEARGVMKATSRQQRNADRWVAATEAKAKEHAKHTSEADLGPGMREQLEIERDRIDQLKAKVSKAEALRAESIDVWKQARTGLGIGRKELRSAKREYAKTGTIAKKVGDRKPIAQYIEELRQSLSGMGKAPAGMLLDEVPESGRLMERKFKHTPESWDSLAKLGMVETDVSHLMDRYTKDMGGRLAWHKAFGGSTPGSARLPELIRKADEDALRWVNEAKDPKERERRQILKDKGLKDLQMVHDRTLGKYDVQDTDPISWGVKAVQNGAYLRIAGGIAWSALQDIGTAMFSTPGFLKGLMSQANQYKKVVRDYEEALAKGDPHGRAEGLRQLMVLATSMENVAFTGVSTRAVGGGSAMEQMGIGHGITRKMTRGIEVAMDNIADKTTWLTGLNFIGDYTRRTAMFVQMSNLRTWTKNMDRLSESQRAQLASLGVGRPEAKRLQELFEKYGREDGKLFDPGLDKWSLEPDGRKWSELFEIVMTKAQNRASYTESFGATPPFLMDNGIAKLLFQFQSHALMTTNNFMRAGLQRGAVTGDYMSGTAAMATSVALGVGVASIRGFMNGKDKLQEWNESPTKLAREVFDRSNLLGAASPYFDAGSKLFGGHINKMVGGKFFEAGTKYSQNNWYESLLGPWLGQIRGMGGTVNDVVNGDMDAAGKKLVRMIPMNQYIRLFQELGKSIGN
jgi:hypothetical protein